MQQIIRKIEAPYFKENREGFSVGDTVRVHVRIVEGRIERIQVFEGVVLGFKNGGLRETFTVRKISFGIGVERIFPLHSPRIERIELVRRGKVRKAKLYYLRKRSGKAARVKELIVSKEKRNKIG